MKSFNMKTLRSWNPCYDPSRHLAEDWQGTAIDILENEGIPFQDRLWVVLRKDLVSERTMRLFAVWSYRQTLAWVKEPDPRSLEAAKVAERFANGEATREELSAVWSAESAVWSAAWSAARSAARSAVWSAESAVWSAVWSAESAAWSAVWSAESAQRDKLIEMIEKEALNEAL